MSIPEEPTFEEVNSNLEAWEAYAGWLEEVLIKVREHRRKNWIEGDARKTIRTYFTEYFGEKNFDSTQVKISMGKNGSYTSTYNHDGVSICEKYTHDPFGLSEREITVNGRVVYENTWKN